MNASLLDERITKLTEDLKQTSERLDNVEKRIDEVDGFGKDYNLRLIKGRNTERESKAHRLIKWFGPVVFAMFGFYCQSACLHYATYTYVHRELQMNHSMPSKDWNANHSTYETLRDPLEDMLQYQIIQLGWLDFVATLFPMTFVGLGVVEMFRGEVLALQSWTKVFTCAGFLFIIKGALGAMTLVPDSSGWQICMGRLKPEGLAWMEEEHTFAEMFSLDFLWISRYHQPLRYCADMMYSGHTFVVTLFGLGCYEVAQIVIAAEQPKVQEFMKSCALCFIAFVAVAEQLIEIYCVMSSHFHYSMDVFMAIIITFLFYTNGAIAVFSKQWEIRGVHFFTMWIVSAAKKLFPKNYNSKLAWFFDVLDEREDDHARFLDVHDERWYASQVWASRGDVVVPPCCVCCACLSGRHHIYSDCQLEDLEHASHIARGEAPIPHQMNAELKKELVIHEGVTFSDLFIMTRRQGELTRQRSRDFLYDLDEKNAHQGDLKIQTWAALATLNPPKWDASKKLWEKKAAPFQVKRWRSMPHKRDDRNRAPSRPDMLKRWMAPFAFCMFGYYFQSVCLHYATYMYVHSRMVKEEGMPSKSWNGHIFNRLDDPFANWLGPEQVISLGWLDAVAAAFPMLFMILAGVDVCLTGGRRTLQVWTKVTVCAGFLFMIKGAVDSMTIVPDANGWAVCVQRLKEEGLQWMEEKHTFGDMILLDFQWNILWYHHPLRYCSDMVNSGHTFTVTLFALGCYELIRINIEHLMYKYKWAETPRAWLKAVCLSLFSAIAIVEQLVEIYCVLRSRFHYSMDVFIALLITFLLYTNASIGIFAKTWERKGTNLLKEILGSKKEDHKKEDVINNGDVPTDKEWKEEEVWVAGGDIFLPVCCFPFCCLAGRQHIYSDGELLAIMHDSFGLKEEQIVDLAHHMNMGEGMSMEAFTNLCSGKAEGSAYGQ